ncbi:conserved hypothetical protein [Leishmania infantum JPCM5]|uniref:SH3_domain /Variant_SH3_domain_containing_protein_-_putative n=2 Tax=Leishmania infantum TaxID=5671 RepID=A0A6L0WL12_LEIIN|nr:conserved hypothetical protein [Leishmania infantum JPCM5]CAC9461930.1 SH3_domain /Variant_SH3_domain_containing_protein_-_putative [Leishmania infantum]CAM66309.1 conserved hypothetical protein [Leishmania infantum JPCM5]SUZ39921.1 SH3_domain /Variant_SH3_domain_containing_protein_-_putative [Leishmania infantum]|eukprot:XP_001463935.1 conserved hypothetical protein [Leishmania infantum JPCM5]
MVQPEQHIVYAIHEYAIPGSGFLRLKAGDVMYVDEADASGWWLGTNLRGQKGVFPSTYTLPYVFPPPAEDILRDMRLILLGRRFGVDVASGAPLPLLERFEAHVCDADTPLPPLALLRKTVDECLLGREAARARVMELLSQLMEIRACEREERERGTNSFAAEQQQVVERKTALREMRATLDASLYALAARKAALLQACIVPTFTWYERLHSLSVAAASSAKSLSSDGAWRSALRDVKEVVKRQEEELTRLSTSCAQQEDVFARAASLLQARIEWRDGNVARMLAYWVAKARAAKTAYTATKVERDAAESRRQLEVAQLRHRLEDGRERFLKTREQYRQLKRRAEEIAVALQRKDLLDYLSRQIAGADVAIATHQERQRRHPAAFA